MTNTTATRRPTPALEGFAFAASLLALVLLGTPLVNGFDGSIVWGLGGVLVGTAVISLVFFVGAVRDCRRS